MQGSKSKRGFALIIALAIFTLVTVVLIAFFVRVTAREQAGASHNNNIRSEIILKSAVDYVAGEFIQEIKNPSNSTSYSNNGNTIFEPKLAANSIPQQMIAKGIAIPGPNFANLIRQSVPVDNTNVSVNPTAVGDVNASEIATDFEDPSNLGRPVSAARWNLPSLLPGAGLVSGQLPNWIYVTNQGAFSTTLTSDVVARIAYNAYNEGGLLNVNVAGYSTSGGAALAASDIASLKGTLSGADLTQLGISQTTINNLVSFRNPSITSAANYVSYVRGATRSGFLTETVTDPTSQATVTPSPFTGRQDFLKWAKLQADPGLTSALSDLTTYSKFVNSPSWSPNVNQVTSMSYYANRNTVGKPNRFLPNVRAGSIFNRLNGNPTTVGEPLIAQRFPLSRIEWLENANPASTSWSAPAALTSDALYINTIRQTFGQGILTPAVLIQDTFGLTWDSNNEYWVYNHGIPNGIYTLDQVASLPQGREPDFFELLKAAILSGSLGRDPGALATGNAGPPASGFDTYSASSDAQILQIGSNIINQALAGNYPVAIYCNMFPATAGAERSILINTFTGQKNLPYIQKLNQIMFQYQTAPSPSVGAWVQPVLWNINRQASTASKDVMPSQFRSVAYDGFVYFNVSLPTGTPPLVPFSVKSPNLVYDGSSQIAFSPSKQMTQAFYAEPTPLEAPISGTSASVASTTAQNSWLSIYPPPSVFYGALFYKFAGFYVGAVQPTATQIGQGAYWVQMMFHTATTFTLECLDRAGKWKPYSQVAGLLNTQKVLYSTQNNNAAWAPYGEAFYEHPDPRTDRFSAGVASTTPTWVPNSPISSSSVSHVNSYWYPSNVTSGFSYTGAVMQLGALFFQGGSQTISAQPGTATYADRDGVIRNADGYLANLTTGDGCIPYHPASTSVIDRSPVILNRPFQSVGELGYVFRDQPFMSLDLSSPTSADAGLMDVFCVNESPALMSGYINLNASPQPVIQALLNGSYEDASSSVPSNPLPPADCATLATQFVNTTTTSNGSGLILNRADLCQTLGQITVASLSKAQSANKDTREAALRSLVSVCDTRTWNIFVDLVAQGGQVVKSPSGTLIFKCESERRVWVNMAIDRFTGKLVDKQVEQVYE